MKERIHRAIVKAGQLHRGQVRKGNPSMPYITHPLAVAMIVQEYVNDEDVIVAAILHDAIEDADYTLSEMRQEFGERVAEIVDAVSYPDVAGEKRETWDERKRLYLEQLEKGPDEALIVALADKIHNMTSYLVDSAEQGPVFAERFNASLSDKQEFHDRVLRVAEARLDHPILDAFRELHHRFSAHLSQPECAP